MDFIILRLPLREPHRGYFRFAVNHARHCPVRHLILYAQNVVNCHFGFSAGTVCKHKLARNVSCRIDSGNVRAHLLVHIDGPSFREIHAKMLQTESFHIRLSPYAQKYLVRPQHLILSHRIPIQEELYALFCENLAKISGHIAVKRAKYLACHLEYRHLASESVEQACKFNPYHSAAYDGKFFRHLLQFQRLSA